jgi:predicted DNA-binding transcriptional regulator AlpA
MIEEIMNRQSVIEVLKQVSGYSEKHIVDRVLKRKDFPPPIRKSGRLEIYRRRDIERWLGLGV